MSLNAPQLAAVNASNELVDIQAGAGTGKTRVVSERTIRLARLGCERVRACTFTKAAAHELEQRIDQADLPPRIRARIQVDTLHGLATGIVARHGSLGSVIDETEAEKIKKAAEANREDPADVRQRNNLWTFDELTPGALNLLQLNMVREDECGVDLLIDEAHDNTRQEWQLARALRPASLTIVGDRAQRIYAWRGAEDMPSGPEWATCPLSDNYRSVQEILDLANRMRIPGRVNLVANRGRSTGGAAPVQAWHRACDEQVLEDWLWTSDGDAPESWAVLARTKDRLRLVAQALEANSIPYWAPVLAGKVWDAPEARVLLDHFYVVADLRDSLHLERCLRHAGWTDRDVHRADAGRTAAACSLWDWACGNIYALSKPADLLRTLYRLHADGADAQDCAFALVSPSGWLQPVPGLTQAMEQIPAGLSLRDFFRWLANPYADADRSEAGGEGVYLGTIHSAKGLEWSNVLVFGLEDGSLPIARRRKETRDESDRLAEELRLFYVAATRAADRLILSHVDQRPSWGRTLDSEPSRFLREAGLLEAAR